MSKLPAIQLYPADWRKDPGIQALDYFEKGVWMEMLFIMHESNNRGFLKINDKKIEKNVLARMLGLTLKKTEKTLKTLHDFGIYSIDENGVIYSRRMVKDEHLRQIRAEAGKLGGSPLLKQKVKQPAKQKATPSSSSSTSSSSSKNKDIIEKIYQAYPKKVGKAKALKAIAKAIKKIDHEKLLSIVEQYAVSRQGEDPQYTPHPSTWFNAERWNDDQSTWKSKKPNARGNRNTKSNQAAAEKATEEGLWESRTISPSNPTGGR